MSCIVHFPDEHKRVEFTPKQLDALAKRSLVSKDKAKGEWVSFNYFACMDVLRTLPDVNICDFCSQSPVAAYYPARDFDMPHVEEGSVGGWYACVECDALIGLNEWEKLSLRAARIFIERNHSKWTTAMQEVALIAMRDLHEKVREEMTGERIQV